MALKFDREAEEQFLAKPLILEAARITTDFAKRHYSDRHYREKNFSLQLRWTPTEEFRAGAFVALNGDHEIRLSYGTAIEIYRDAFVLPQTCQHVLVKNTFDPIFNLLSYGNLRQDVLPAGLSALDAKLDIIRLMSTWLYLHEQAHLLQRHGDIAKGEGASELLSNDAGLEDSAQGGPILSGREAAMRHAFEFAADYEAINNLVMFEAISGISEAKLWCLAAGLMCMFQRFYGASSMSVEDVARGSHPHPAVRMRMVMNQIEQLIELPAVAAQAAWTKGPAQARAVMDHAVYTADVYWHLRYVGLDSRSPFLDITTTNLVVPLPYQRVIFDAWKSVRAKIVAGHLGFGEGVVLFLRQPEAIGSRREL